MKLDLKFIEPEISEEDSSSNSSQEAEERKKGQGIRKYDVDLQDESDELEEDEDLLDMEEEKKENASFEVQK